MTGVVLHLLANAAVVWLAVGSCGSVLARLRLECATEFKAEPALWAELVVVAVHVAVAAFIIITDWI